MPPFNQYLNIKDKICIYYEGHSTEYLVQLRLLRRSLEKTFPNTSITYACRSQYFVHLTNDPLHISLEQFQDRRNDFGCSILMIYNATEGVHPVWDMVKKAMVSVDKHPLIRSQSHHGIICPEGNFPTRSLEEHQLSHLRNWVNMRGFKPLVVGTSNSESGLPIDKRPSPEERTQLARTAGFVVGVECDMIYEAIDAGVPTALVRGCKELYEALCAKPTVFAV